MTERVPDETSLPELTLRGLILGALITIVFTGSNVYLGLKIGLTFASSIPAAVISMAALRLFKTANILENNMVQTQASAAGTLSSIIFVMPGLVMLGRWHGFPFVEVFGLSALGGILGVLFTIPLRRAMVVESDLVYPEGVAGAEILRAGAQPGGVANILVGGLAAGMVSVVSSGFHLLAEDAAWFFRIGTPVFRIGTAFSLALLGAGFLVGILGGGRHATWAVHRLGCRRAGPDDPTSDPRRRRHRQGGNRRLAQRRAVPGGGDDCGRRRLDPGRAGKAGLCAGCSRRLRRWPSSAPDGAI